MNKITVTDVIVGTNRIDIKYNAEGEVRKHFTDYPFFAEYSQSIEGCPQSIAVIPILCQLLPISWVCDAEIVIDKLDYDFYNSIEDFKRGYAEMLPNMRLGGKLTVREIIISSNAQTNKTAMLFSGGADSFYTLLNKLDEKPDIVTLWGSDIRIDNVNGWEVVYNHLQDTSDQFCLMPTFIKTSFRLFLNEASLNNEVIKKANDGWWHDFQHGIGIVGHMAPYAYQNGLKKVYISSSYTYDEIGKMVCASLPTIDGRVRFCGTEVEHFGCERDRSEKIAWICDYCKVNDIRIIMRVCWKSTDGKNCCRCEKCMRTILTIISLNVDPFYYGFTYSNVQLKKGMRDLYVSMILMRQSRPEVLKYWYFRSKELLLKHYSLKTVPSYLKWIYEFDFDRTAPSLYERYLVMVHRTKNLSRRVKNRAYRMLHYKLMTFNRCRKIK